MDRAQCLPTLDSNVRREVAAKRLIFTVTTGRSGTALAARLLDAVPGVSAWHEPAPDFADVMREAQSDPVSATRFWTERKLPHIATLAEPIYAETSHLLSKGFLEPLLDLGFTPDLVILTRAHRQVACSLYRLGTIPGRTASGCRYLLHPDDPEVLPLPGWHELHDYQLCYWYCLEVRRRSLAYSDMLRGRGRVVWIDLDELQGDHGLSRLRRELELPHLDPAGWRRYRVLRHGPRVNAKEGISEGTPVDALPVESLEREVVELTHGGEYHARESSQSHRRGRPSASVTRGSHPSAPIASSSVHAAWRTSPSRNIPLISGGGAP